MKTVRMGAVSAGCEGTGVRLGCLIEIGFERRRAGMLGGKLKRCYVIARIGGEM